MPTVAVIDYGSGNLRSAAKALAAVGGASTDVVVTSDAAVVARAARIVLPGQGAFAECMRGLSAVPGMLEVLADAVRRRGVPFLGICVGMQLLADRGLEHGAHQGFGWIGGDVMRLDELWGGNPGHLPIPQMGWNGLSWSGRAHPLLEGLRQGDHVYFVHSYALRAASAEDVIATTDYGGAVTAAVARANVAGVQFHPEKSQAVGLRILANFLRWSP
ncbi:imidazole glycerol phosphate synthase subunit HisH [Elioraea sp.]|uniref:imidazole glycerol phosphate synthase subunit HisH n=1 Tax=Elioraea sp. TaxID=2185103 RepID=UPI0025B9B87B|nr:imidazole glycerol phosphate synthase subunit HisH [Elioraea sp.]